MTKLGQLQLLDELGLHTAPFVGISHQDFVDGKWAEHTDSLRFPVAVRSSFGQEDGDAQSMAGHFHTALNVQQDGLSEAIQSVFASYPSQISEQVIVQEMVQAEVSGVLFAHRNGIWKTEMVRGAGEALVSGKVQPMTLLLPKFTRTDYTTSWLRQPWRPFGADREKRAWVRPLMYLALATGKLLEATAETAPLGLDIEFAIRRGQCYVLQARPITTPEELEEVLTSANHKEILPPRPSRFMTGLIASCSRHLFAYYRKLDPRLPDRNFIEVSEGMPWINLTALLDTMIAWGLPTSLVCESVGAEDVYRVGVRPYQGLKNWRIFVKILKEQLSVAGRTRRWVRATQRRLLQETEARRIQWRNSPEIAYQNWLTSAQLVYVDLVSLMQALTGAMSGPTKLFAKLGWLQQLSDQSESSRYLQAFRQWRQGDISLEKFLHEYGHRGFYESDMGQKRFAEFGQEDWAKLGANLPRKRVAPSRNRPWINRLTRPVVRLLHTREWLRHHTMRYFFMLRSELMEESAFRFGKAFNPFDAAPEELHALWEGSITLEAWEVQDRPPSAGWDMDTFLWNRHDRRLPVSHLVSSRLSPPKRPGGLGIYPGKLTGQIWKVGEAELASLKKPDFEQTILLTESLDPGWIPYFVQVQGVLSYVGGILSHASIILRESALPSITQLPRDISFQTGDWVEIDAKKGIVKRLEGPPQAS